jgi:hypothetical protein
MSGGRARPIEMTADLVTAPGSAVAPPEAPRRPRPGLRPPAELPEIVEETLRKTVSVKLSAETIDRLREYTHRTRHQKQDVVEVAVVRFLDAEGY